MIKKINYLLFFVVMSVFVVFSCRKPDIATPPELSHFMNSAAISYPVQDIPNSVFKFGIGLTAPAKVDRNITFSVSSPTGAVEGQQYTVASKSITIPAGKTIDSISLKGIFNGFPGGRRDTLVFTITGGDVPALIGSDVLKVVLQKFCPLDMSIFSGNFEVLDDDWQDYFPGDVVTLSVSGNVVSFDYPTPYNHQPLLITVNPTTFATTVPLTAFGRYSASGTTYTAKSVAGASSVVIPCDRIISVVLAFGNTGGGNYGNGLLRLRKL
jgi:hypothetical protein